MGILSLFRRKAAAPAPAGLGGPSSPAVAAETKGTAVHARPMIVGAVLLRPHVTEKATVLQAENRYAFRVAKGATKPEVRRAVERQYGVHVSAVRLHNVPGKKRRRGRIVGRVPGYRKAIVTVRSGERVEFAEAAR